MRVIAITGGIGSGKSTLSALFAQWGAVVVDADAISRKLTAPNGEALPRIRDVFGDTVFHADGTLDRAALAGRVFGDDTAALAKLNAIMHPLIIRDSVRALDLLRAQGVKAAVIDAPLLFETGMDALADAIVCVTAPLAVRLRRIGRRDALTREQALKRIRSQNPAARNESLADYVFTTNTPMFITRWKARTLWKRILADGARRTPDAASFGTATQT